MKLRRHPPPLPARPNGSVAVPFAIILPVVLGMMGFAIDLSMLYLRNTEMQQMADSTAMAAARRLDGTLAGINAAISDAETMAAANSYGGEYSGSKNSFTLGTSWSASALLLSTAPSGAPWVPAESVTDAATAADMIYVKVDTSVLSGLSGNPGRVATTLMRFLGAQDYVTAAPVAVAGQTGMQVTPLALCALKTIKFAPRPSSAGNELVEFGYRRGVPYDLLNLSFSGAAAQRFVVNPIDDRRVSNPDPSHYSNQFIKPFFCSGSLAYPGLRAGADVYVKSIDSLGVDIHDWLNSRFDDVVGDGDACPQRNGAPPDSNVREFTPSNVAWMKTDRFSARPFTDSQLYTVADPVTLPTHVEVKDYGPLWVNAKPVKFVSAAVGGGTTPVAFKINDMPVLYPVNAGPAWVVPTLTYKDPPYKQDKPVSPSGTVKVDRRRIVNLPLLDCSGAVVDRAPVLGVGQFLLTAKATSSSVYAEFEGLVDESTLVSNVRRLQ
jgi:Flp pilus assembly protein TadG